VLRVVVALQRRANVPNRVLTANTCRNQPMSNIISTTMREYAALAALNVYCWQKRPGGAGVLETRWSRYTLLIWRAAGHGGSARMRQQKRK
jgi:hypothetical protein